ncbi:MAG TPA: penicillin-binding protein 1A [Xanthobacteraceae bacterium]|nr:penicillin-binding protein 1A [Xanthobacteraceae bacterium]
MARRGSFSERREPVLGAPGVADLRLGPDDRPTLLRAGDTKPAAKGSAKTSTKSLAKSSAKPKAGRPRRGGKPRAQLVRRVLYWGCVLGLWAVIGVAGLVAYEASRLPPIQTLAIPERPPTIIIQDEAGRTLATRGEMRGGALPLRALPPYLPQAFVAIEDRRFYAHSGLDVLGLGRAVFVNLTSGRLREGGSTLTQQLAKNLFLTQERTISRKIQELILAIWLETKYSKNEILELYVNRVYFGAGAYGVEAAAQRYFGKSARQVTLSEAAMLAGLVKSPSALAPTRNLKAAQERAELVLAAMLDAGFIAEGMFKTAEARPATLSRKPEIDSSGYVADWVMEQLVGVIGPLTRDVTVRTTINAALQTAAERTLEDALARNGAKLGVGQGAVVALDTDGAVRALVGGRSYDDSQFNRAVTARRQPGSAFKPFVYLAALERGLTPDTVREDAPVKLKGWKPENYSHDYRGPVTLQQALALSLNTVSIRLTLEVGPAAVASTAKRLGIGSKLDANPSIALGTSEVSVLELASAYAPFANGGVGVVPHVIDSVRDDKGKVIYSSAGDNLGQVVSPAYVGMMNRMLRETLLTGTARRADLPGWPAAGKTGTSQDYRDAWFVGYTNRFVTAVWLGNDDASPTKKASGSGLPVEIWSRVMRSAHEGLPVTGLPGAEPMPSAPPPGGELPDEPAVSGLPNFFPGLFPSTAPSAPPGRAPEGVRPPGNVGGPRAPTLDNWLMEKLFGQR